MAMEGREITFEIREHIGVLDTYTNNNGETWTKEINVVAWNGGKPKIDIRDWDSSHKRMGRGITLTVDQAMKMTKALVERYRSRSEQSRITPDKGDIDR